MSGRASIKGQGASIFFDREVDEAHTAQDRTGQSVDAVAPAGSGISAPWHPDAPAPGQERAEPPANPPAEAPEPGAAVREFYGRLVLPPSLKRTLRAMTREQHPYHTSVRITKREQDALKALAFELSSKLQVPVTVNDIARFALRLMWEDYELRKKESLLVQVLKED